MLLCLHIHIYTSYIYVHKYIVINWIASLMVTFSFCVCCCCYTGSFGHMYDVYQNSVLMLDLHTHICMQSYYTVSVFVSI